MKGVLDDLVITLVIQQFLRFEVPLNFLSSIFRLGDEDADEPEEDEREM